MRVTYFAQQLESYALQEAGVPERLVFEYLRQQGYWETARAAGPSLTCSTNPIPAADLQVRYLGLKLHMQSATAPA